MQAIRTPAFLRTAANALGALLLVPLLTACPKGDVGAPCHHGDVDPPVTQVVTFPALNCNDLICVYAEDKAAPPNCKTDMECNSAEADGSARFQCIQGTCKLSPDFVLERSMCSKTCGSDDDCKDGGIGKQVQAKDSSCQDGFSCVQLQTLGGLCCRKLCVCNDDLSPGQVEEVANACAEMGCEEDMAPPVPVDMTSTT